MSVVKQCDRVMVTGGDLKGRVGTIDGVDPRSANGDPCPCCGYGASIQFDGDPWSSWGVSPRDVVPVVSGPVFLSAGGDA